MKIKTQQVRAERRKQAETMQAAYDKLSLQEKIDKLPIGGANKQRTRLLKLQESQKK